MRFYQLNENGQTSLVTAAVLTVLFTLIGVGMSMMNEIQRKSSLQGAASGLGKDASSSAVEILNQLMKAEVIRVYQVAWPLSAPTKDQRYLMPDLKTGQSKSNPPTPIGLGWTFNKGYVKNLVGAPEYANLVVTTCDPRTANLISMFTKTNPTMPALCDPITAKVWVVDVQDNKFIEVISESNVATQTVAAGNSVLASLLPRSFVPPTHVHTTLHQKLELR